ncbi:hypothetical protein [Nonomuraea longicatena]|jgi:hypothetical protein|uniref:Uncharacterized protein n=1 Tax=Nonomuraea longicatena TaxID=83682 RepID=A0ABN1QH53_9ACTN
MQAGYFVVAAIGLIVIGAIAFATVFIVLKGIKGGQWPTLKR